MRLAQALLDEAQAERSRTLAAFAVTVGDDGSIADMMGLNEREVRLARRTVGRGDARSLAQELLSRTQQATREAPAEPAPEIPVPHPREEVVVAPLDTPPPAPAPPPPSLPPVEMENTVVWSPSMDSVLLWSWESGLDVQTVAAELGLDVRALLMRVQELANDGLLTLTAPVAEVSRSGRHRRQHEDGYATLFAPTTTFPTHVPY
ncbi:hypothetical protein [Streptomyces sp. BE133]|uniref:hypothetical protein n=1 Tax=Streptomyces sp. BE133 TaxID=3002523 RepID=UPI002E75EC8C|nr:hypothetical protein [Streptomyces sp. BE133]MEE1807967.1 hypothetical protein [Streptomyces sp. BE133]